MLAALPIIAATPVAWANPAEPDVTDPSAPTAPDQGPAPAALAADPAASSSVVSDACRQFGSALDLAASNYEDFAYATAGNGNSVDYQNPEVWRSNVIGRTALREAAHAALTASRSPGLPPDVADSMQTWSLHATKLLLIMGLRGGGDSLNSAASDLNTDARNAQMACALEGAN
ncbi:hypothetical protein ORI20_14755 [Mycobacterium sp. CVI_P3]|uniref:Lipoprotein LpqV n=1 Tax=Mycobacterium pinniadriaticum TaxID=2994102 RepID=A0ABT3SEX7_9MYCO|nr:hypothetical protein [Mycobacterium pinniadriaticum]MCX2931538.1 hypothetical protein [Mycobacterium pinniadriaticum]MCX2938070.1 hypothetical protein [Mycobacterium pinniadriaticum]